MFMSNKNSEFDVIVIGDNNVDLVTNIGGFPYRGGCSYGVSPFFSPGGSALNTAVGLKKLGLKVGFITCFGNCTNGKFIRDFLLETKIDISCTKSVEYSNGMVICIISDDDGERTFFALRKNCADTHLVPGDIKEEYIKKASFLFITGVPFFEENTTNKAIEEAVNIAKRNRIKIFFDPNLRLENKNITQEKKNEIKSFLKSCDVFMPSEDEMELLFDNVKEKEINKFFDNNRIEIWLKQGKKGSIYYSNGKKIKFKPHQVNVVDTTGAGDSYNSAVMYGYIKLKDINEIGKIASIASSITVSRKGSSISFPDINEILNDT